MTLVTTGNNCGILINSNIIISNITTIIIFIAVSSTKKIKKTWKKQVEEEYLTDGLSNKNVFYHLKWIAGKNGISTKVR